MSQQVYNSVSAALKTLNKLLDCVTKATFKYHRLLRVTPPCWLLLLVETQGLSMTEKCDVYDTRVPVLAVFKETKLKQDIRSQLCAAAV